MPRKLYPVCFVLICSLIVPFLGCSNRLSESKAKKLINTYLEQGNIGMVVYLGSGQTIKDGWYKNTTPENDKLRPYCLEMEKKGLIKLTYSQDGSSYVRQVVFTEEGQKYVINTSHRIPEETEYTVVTGILKVDKITGITEPANMFGGPIRCNVEFVAKIEPTPFWPSDKTLPSPQTKKVFVDLYNDGWRVGGLY